VANTNSTYGVNAFTSGIAEPAGAAYILQNTDYQGIVQFDTNLPVALTLNSAVRQNFSCDVLNQGTGAITLTPTLGYLVNGSSSLALGSGVGCTLYFANRAWTAYVGATYIPVVPETLVPVAGEYVTGYNATTGVFSTSSTAGVTGTATLAKLTGGGATGSLTFVGGICTGIVNPT
jgi:hypothetical protein